MGIIFYCALQYWIFTVNVNKNVEQKFNLYITNIYKVDCHCKKTLKYFDQYSSHNDTK